MGMDRQNERMGVPVITDEGDGGVMMMMITIMMTMMMMTMLMVIIVPPPRKQVRNFLDVTYIWLLSSRGSIKQRNVIGHGASLRMPLSHTAQTRSRHGSETYALQETSTHISAYGAMLL